MKRLSFLNLLLLEVWAPTSDLTSGSVLLLVFYEIDLSLCEALQLRVLNLLKWEENPCVKFNFFFSSLLNLAAMKKCIHKT